MTAPSPGNLDGGLAGLCRSPPTSANVRLACLSVAARTVRSECSPVAGRACSGKNGLARTTEPCFCNPVGEALRDLRPHAWR